MGLTTMDPAGIAAAMTGADDLGPKNNTNLWAGIKEGLDVLHESVTSSSSAVDVDRKSSWLSKTKKTKNPAAAATAPQRLRTILLLTDGEPNVEPQGGHLAALGEYFRTHPGYVNVSPFGNVSPVCWGPGYIRFPSPTLFALCCTACSKRWHSPSKKQ